LKSYFLINFFIIANVSTNQICKQRAKRQNRLFQPKIRHSACRSNTARVSRWQLSAQGNAALVADDVMV